MLMNAQHWDMMDYHCTNARLVILHALMLIGYKTKACITHAAVTQDLLETEHIVHQARIVC